MDEIIYVNSSHKDLFYVREAAASAASFRRYLPDAHYVLYTDATDFRDPAFDEIRPAEFSVPPQLANAIHKNGQMATKLEVLPSIEADRAMYLGSDTYALKPEAASLLALLERFDIAAAHAPMRINTTRGNEAPSSIPACFPEFNCDVLVWKPSTRVREALTRWRDLYLADELGHAHDQGPFRLVTWTSDLQIATLPDEYNYRGKDYRDDVVVLQSREVLHLYTSGNPDTAPPRSGGTVRPQPRPVRAVNRGLRALRLPVKVTRTWS